MKGDLWLWHFIPSLTFTELRMVSIEHLQGVWHASRARLTFRTPDSVMFETCICPNCLDPFSLTCHDFPDLSPRIYYTSVFSGVCLTCSRWKVRQIPTSLVKYICIGLHRYKWEIKRALLACYTNRKCPVEISMEIKFGIRVMVCFKVWSITKRFRYCIIMATSSHTLESSR